MLRISSLSWLMLIGPTAVAQNASLAGTVMFENGTPAANIAVVETRIPEWAEIAENRNWVKTVRSSAQTDSSGRFAFAGLTAGRHVVCAQASGDGILSSCRWGDAGQLLQISAAQARTGITITLRSGTIVTMLFHDPHQRLAGRSNWSPSVMSDVGQFVTARRDADQSNGVLKFLATVPKDHVGFIVLDRQFAISGDTGIVLRNNIPAMPFSAGKRDNVTLNFSIQ